MKHYFEVTYPRRLEDLKKILEPLAIKIYKLAREDESKKEETTKCLQEFQDHINHFCDNTKLHITGLKTGSMDYLHMVTREYLIQFVGKESASGKILSLLKTKKVGKEE